MKTTQHPPFLSEIAIGEPIPVNKLAFFQARLRNRLFDLVLKRFLEQQNSGLTKAELARRIGKSPEQITRLLGAPGNWTLDTASDLLIGIAGEELKMGTESVLGRVARNYQGQDSHPSSRPLLRTAFTTNDPESLEGLIEDVPASDELPFVELSSASHLRKPGRTASQLSLGQAVR